MALAFPVIAVLDSSTLGKVASDYWSADEALRGKARSFLARLTERGVYIAITFTHVSELLRYGSEEAARDRIKFLSGVTLIAWLRPYDRKRFPGWVPDLFMRELHAIVHGSAHGWREVVEKVRPELWETCTGLEMFGRNDQLWSRMRDAATRLHENEKYVASLARTDPGGLFDVKLRDLLQWPGRPKEEWTTYAESFADDLRRQLQQHGDKRIRRSQEMAIDFAGGARERAEAIDASGGDEILQLIESANVPKEFIDLEMTIGEIGELAVYAKQLKLFAEGLNPPVQVDMRDVPPDSLPSYVLQQKLASVQQKADRVSGSDLGDRYLAPLALYADAVEVDKRTLEFLRQVTRAEPRLASLTTRFFRSSDYLEVAERFDRMKTN